MKCGECFQNVKKRPTKCFLPWTLTSRFPNSQGSRSSTSNKLNSLPLKLVVIGRVPGGPSLKLETRPLYQIQAFVPQGRHSRTHEGVNGDYEKREQSETPSRILGLNATNSTPRRWVSERGKVGNRAGDPCCCMCVSGWCTYSGIPGGVYIPDSFLNTL